MIGREGLHRDVVLRLLSDAGAANGASHLATGNVTFDAPSREANAIARRFEAGIADVLGRHEPVIIRRLDWLAAFVATEPFSSYDEKEWSCSSRSCRWERSPSMPMPSVSPRARSSLLSATASSSVRDRALAGGHT